MKANVIPILTASKNRKAMKASEANTLAKEAIWEFEENEDYLGKTLDKIRALAKCGMFGVIIQFQYVVEHAEYKKVEKALIMLGYDAELYSDYLQVRWVE